MDYWFVLKKTASLYLNPLTITLEMVILGLVLIGFSRRASKKKRGKKWLRFKRWMGDAGVLMIVLGSLFLFLCSIDPIGNSLIYYLEKQYPGLPEDKDGHVLVFDFKPEYIVVLAGGAKPTEAKPVLSILSQDALARVSGAAILWKQFPDTQMIMTGTPAETGSMERVAVVLGVDKKKILQESESRDTKDHPLFIKPMVGDSPFFLVTSGYHMPRAMSLFRKQGLDPKPAPNDFRVWPKFDEYNPYQTDKLFPKVINVQRTDRALHEILGMAWADFRDQTKEGETEGDQKVPKAAPQKAKEQDKPEPEKEAPEIDDKEEKEKPNPRGTLAEILLNP